MEIGVVCPSFFQTWAFAKDYSLLNRDIIEGQGFVLLKLFYVSKLPSKQLVPTLFVFSRSHRDRNWFPSVLGVMVGLTMITKMEFFPLQIFQFDNASTRAWEFIFF